MGKGALPDDHPLTLGMTGFWGTQYINDSCRSADYILALGTRFCEADCSSWEGVYTFNMPPTRLIHIDIDPSEIGRNYPVELGVIADLKQALTVLNRVARTLVPQPRVNESLRRGDRRVSTHIQDRPTPRPKRASSFRCGRSASWRTCGRCCRATRLSRLTSAGTRTASASSSPIYEPGSILTPGGYATMGFGAPAALGAKIACPDRVVVSLVGDGGFGQNPSVLATAVEQNVAVVWVVMNNLAYGTIAGLEKAHFGTTFGTVFRERWQAVLAETSPRSHKPMVSTAVRIESAAQFKPALEQAVKCGKPYVLDVIMENAPVPTTGHWNIMDIYSPGQKRTHVSV